MSEKTKRHGVGRIGFEGCFKQCMCGQKFNDWDEFNAHIDGMFKELEANTPERTDERQAEIEAVLLDRIQILTRQLCEAEDIRRQDSKVYLATQDLFREESQVMRAERDALLRLITEQFREPCRGHLFRGMPPIVLT